MAKAVRPIDLTIPDKVVRPSHDDLRAAKGIILVCLIGSLLWAIVCTAVGWFFLA
jgi:hypothetical protein